MLLIKRTAVERSERVRWGFEMSEDAMDMLMCVFLVCDLVCVFAIW